MRRRRGVGNNPILVGTGAVLVILVTVLLSYNANEGLPFVPTYNVRAELPGGANLVVGNDVRIGGARVGLVSSIAPKREGTEYYAEVTMKLDKKIEPLPKDSRLVVRPRSTIGLKYIQLTEGKSPEGIPQNGLIPRSQAIRASEFDDLLNTLRPEVRNNYRKVLIEFGNGLAGRGGDINDAFGELNPLLESFEPFMRMLSDRSTGFERFLKAIARVAGDFAPVADQGGNVFVNADITFAGFASATVGIQETLEEAPSALDTFTEELPKQRPYLRKVTRLVEAFDPAAPYLPAVSDDLAVIATKGQPALRHLYRSTPAFQQSFMNFGEFAADPMVVLGVKNLVTFNRVLNGQLGTLTPAQTKCNYAGLVVRNVASALSDRGTDAATGGLIGWLRFGAQVAYAGTNSEGTPSSGPATVNNPQTGTVAPQWDYLHSNPYPDAYAPGRSAECASGNEVTHGAKTPGRARLGDEVLIGNPSGSKGAQTEDSEAVNPDVVKK